MIKQQFYTRQQLATMYGVTPKTIDNRVEAGKLPPPDPVETQTQGKKYWRLDDLENWGRGEANG